MPQASSPLSLVSRIAAPTVALCCRSVNALPSLASGNPNGCTQVLNKAVPPRKGRHRDLIS